MMTTQAATQTAHPFSHMAPAPYRYDGLRDSETINDQLWRAGALTSSYQSEGSCVGTCQHCGTAISIAVHFRGADGTRFHVGSDCAKKAFKDYAEPTLETLLKKDINARNKRKADARKEKALAEVIERIEANIDVINSLPHPRGFVNQSLGDYLAWYRSNAGQAKFIEIATTALAAAGI